MKSLIIALTLAVAGAGLAPTDADAKRLGGGGSSGMQRSTPARAPDSVPAKPATPAAAPNAAAAPAAAAAPKRSWMGPIAGLAAGLGIAALMSHFGMGGDLGNIVTMVLFALLAVFAIRFLMRRFMPGMTSGMKPAMATANETPNAMQFNGAAPAAPVAPASSNWVAPVAAAAAASALPAGFDAPAFERIAKMIFIRMQAANDNADLNDLRTFTTPEMFATIKLDLQDRGSAAQQTDVVRVDAEVLEVASEAERQIVSVRFHGLIREEANGVAAPFDEVWHLVKPADGSREWAIAGIQQSAMA